MFSSTSQMLLAFLCLLSAAGTLIPACMSHLNDNVVCNEKDHHMLSIFKQSIEDPFNSLSSWSNELDCCNWVGVYCNITGSGRVTALQLTGYGVGGEFNFSTLDLEFLSYLDLSSNYFKVIDFESNLASFENQSSHKVKFSNLLHLDLSYNYYLKMDNLRWVPHLSSLKYLDLTWIDLYKENLWLQHVAMLPSLMELHLKSCALNGINLSLRYVNFTSLTLLDISWNFINAEMPKWLFNISHAISYLDFRGNSLRGQIPTTMLNCQQLKYLDLSLNNLNGSIPKWIGQFKYLEHLDLFHNMLEGPVPETIGNLSSLTLLDVRFNRLNGSIPMDLWHLSKLVNLSVGYNSISGNLSEQSFTKLTNLKELNLDSSDFNFNFDTHWNPPFQLEKISISNCKVGPEFPLWLYTQRNLTSLDISSSGLSFKGDNKFWSFVTQIDDELNLSNNSISGNISAILFTTRVIDLHSNNLEGLLPRLSPEVSIFIIANNNFHGSIYTLLCQSITRKYALKRLDMSHNLLSGQLSDCWMHWPFLVEVNLDSNNLTGTIPESMGSLTKLKDLRLKKNMLYGNIPSSLKSSKDLEYLDLSYNEFNGNIPSWIPSGILILLLRSNKFSGNIPSQICQISSLQVLDLANNILSGPIPNCLSNITSMVISHDLVLYVSGTWSEYNDDRHLSLIVKGQELDYSNVLNFICVLDLSNNALSGSIPAKLYSLIVLRSLNLSHNHLTGNISSDIGHMRFLESLDLSSNLFSGEIPQSMSSLSFLSALNLSYNNFNGRIPLGTQLQSFKASSYIGNLQLCGPPLPNNCLQEDEPNSSMEFKGDDDDDFKTSFQLGAGVGFASGFWGVCSIIFFIKKWRHAFFRTLENFHVIVLIKVNRFLYERQ